MEFLTTFIEGGRVGLRKITFEEDQRIRAEWREFCKTDSMTQAYELLQTYAAFPPAVQVPEGQAYPPEFDRIPGFQQKIQPVMWGLGTRYTIQEAYTRQYAQLKEHTRYMVASFRYAQEIEAARLFNEGFTTLKGADGVSIFNTAHPREDGGATQSNRPSAHKPLTPNNLMSELIEFHKIKSGRGNIMPILSDTYKLVIPPDLMFVAKEILTSGGKAYTADNTRNVLGDFNVVVSHYMTGSTNWFLMHPDHDVTMWTRIPLDVHLENKGLQIFEWLAGEFVLSVQRWRHLRGIPEA